MFLFYAFWYLLTIWAISVSTYHFQLPNESLLLIHPSGWLLRPLTLLSFSDFTRVVINRLLCLFQLACAANITAGAWELPRHREREPEENLISMSTVMFSSLSAISNLIALFGIVLVSSYFIFIWGQKSDNKTYVLQCKDQIPLKTILFRTF